MKIPTSLGSNHMMNWFSVSVIIAVNAILASGCASTPAPTEQLAVSRAAITSAVRNGGEEYAQLELKAAVENMEGAERAMTANDYVLAGRLAEQAQRDATLAETKTGLARAQQWSDRNIEAQSMRAGRDSVDRRSRLLAMQPMVITQENTNQEAPELAAVESRVGQIEAELDNSNVRATERRIVITLGDLSFDTNKDELSVEGIDSVQKLAEYSRTYPERKLLIEGFTDSTGSSRYNRDLSHRRANAVRDALMRMGVSGLRVSARGYGEANPVGNNETPAGRQQNRRVIIVIVDKDSEIVAR
ncbi:MAG: ompA/MotB domain-containing protein [Gammaproteobacteria bacterium]|nr:MAG: ompA/MotB domain-containing protein [Gammaproteobacteria bacterium]TND05042.1 MAG: ompA/MotB domain-containing protein [Gammaproteobacteria bacterium]